MPLFLITFLSLYGGMHAYAFVRLRQAFQPGSVATAAMAAAMIVMTIAPILVRLAEKSGLVRTAAGIAWPGYLWMGSIFILAATLLTVDMIRFAAWLVHIGTGFAVPGILSAAVTGRVALAVALPASVYAVHEAGSIRTEHIELSTGKLPAGVARIRVVQLSDVHAGLIFPASRLKSILAAVRAADPDILVSTGDFVDGRLSRENVAAHLDGTAARFAELKIRGGKYAVTGNHEFYAGLDQAAAFCRKAGFTLLRNRTETACGLSLTGVDDSAGMRMKPVPAVVSERQLLDEAPAGSCRILLKHRPDVIPDSDGRFDLQLSGHVHKGQIFPFNLLVRLQYPIPCGTSATQGGAKIHVSRGTGTWGPPMRFLAPPEITVIDFIPAP